MIYFNYPSLGIPNEDDLKEAQRFLSNLPDAILQSDDYTLEMVSIVEEVRKQIADVYCVSPDNIAFITNTTEGLGLIASALQRIMPVRVLVPDIEFMSSALVWDDRNDLNGKTFCPTEQGAVFPDSLNKYLSNGCNILCMSSVQEVSGYRFSFQDLLTLREKDTDEFWIIDGIQEAGIFKRNLIEDQIDAYIVGGHKWLNSPFGLGFMYISDRLLAKVRPAFYGYFNLEEPETGWVSYLESRSRTLGDLTSIPKKGNATKFESGGMMNALGALMLGKNIDRWKEVGFKKSSEHVLQLQQLFRDSFNWKSDFNILGGKDVNSWSSIVTLTNTGNPDKERDLLKKLSSKGVKASLRSAAGIGGIRLGFHYITTKEEVESLLEYLS